MKRQPPEAPGGLVGHLSANVQGPCPPARPLRAAAAALALLLAIAACGASPTGSAAASMTTTALAGGIRAASASTITRASSPLRGWPQVITQAMMYVRKRGISVRLEAPTSLAGPPSSSNLPNSAIARAGANYYTVLLYSCPSPLPLNDPGIGSGSCGAMESVYGGFGGERYPSPAAAASALASKAGEPPSSVLDLAACPTTQQVPLQARMAATVRSHAGRDCEVVWHEGHWKFTLYGDLTRWTVLAHRVVSYLDQHLLPGTRGDLFTDLAGDGDHTSTAWVLGNSVYFADVYHQVVPDLALAVAMAPYPGAF